MIIGGTVRKAELVRLGEQQDNVLLVHLEIFDKTLVFPLPGSEAAHIHLDQFMKFSVENQVYTPERKTTRPVSTVASNAKVRPLPTIAVDEVAGPPTVQQVQRPNLDISSSLSEVFPQDDVEIVATSPKVETQPVKFTPEEILTVAPEAVTEEDLIENGPFPLFDEEEEAYPEEVPLPIDLEEVPPQRFASMEDFLHGEG